MSEVPEGIGELRGHCWRGRSDKACRRQGRCLGNRMREFRDGGATGAISQNRVSGQSNRWRGALPDQRDRAAVTFV